MNDSQYDLIADELLLRVEEAIEESLENTDEEIDYEGVTGLLTLTFKNNTKIILNKQAPLHEIWVATKFNGHHFVYQEDHWQDKRNDVEFWQFISAAVSKQAGFSVTLNAS